MSLVTQFLIGWSGGSTCNLTRKDASSSQLPRIEPGIDGDGLIFGLAGTYPNLSIIKEDVYMSDFPNCPKCNSEYAYDDGLMFICPECSHEWSKDVASDSSDNENIIKDANGNPLQDGDTVTVIKGLKIKGSSQMVKVGTKVKNIRLVDGDHNIDCKIDGIGAMKLKSEFVKKV